MPTGVQYTVLTLPQSAAVWHIVDQYLKLRRKVFVDRLSWSLGGDDQREYEEYDSGPYPHYVIAHKDGRTLAGTRLIRCDTEFGEGENKRSYMIRDAFLGRINLPKELWRDGVPPTDPQTWELTRFVSITKDLEVARNILKISQEYVARQGAKRCLCLSTPSMLRLAKRYGYETTPLSEILGNKDGKFVTFSFEILRN